MKLFSQLRKRQQQFSTALLPRLSAWRKPGQQLDHWQGMLIAPPVMAILVIALRFTGGLQLLEWAMLDQFFRLRLPEAVDERIVIVGINETDIQKIGKWPIPDAVMAELLNKIKQQQPRAIGLDIYRDLPVEPGHNQLTQVFQTTPNLVGIETLGFGIRENAVAPPPELNRRNQIGFNNITVDADDKLRRALLYIQTEAGETKLSFGMKLALRYLETENIFPATAASNPNHLQLGRSVFPRFRTNDGGYIRADDIGYHVLLNFRGPARSFRTVSLHDVLDNRLPADLLRDRVVLIGSTAISLRDFFSTPYSGAPVNFGNGNPITTPEQTSGVEVQANVLSMILGSALDARPLFQVWQDPLEWLWILTWSYIGALLGWKVRSLVGATLAVALPGSLLVVGCYLAFLSGWWLPVVPSFLVMFSSATVLTAYIAKLEQEDRQTIMNLFERHVTQEIAEAIWRDRKHLLQQGRLPGRRMAATILFSDLANFTPIAEQTDPEVLMSWLNEYLEAMAQIIIAHRGVVDKFIGDSVMAVFGVPIPRTTPEEVAEDACQSIQCALAMADRLELLNQKWQQQGLPTVTMRLGISTGTVLTGSLGGLQKLDYTAIGDSVNVAARLESYDKSFEKTTISGVCRILISEDTYEYVRDRFPVQLVSVEKLKGREQLSRIYQILIK